MSEERNVTPGENTDGEDAQLAFFSEYTRAMKAIQEKDAREAREQWAREGKPPLSPEEVDQVVEAVLNGEPIDMTPEELLIRTGLDPRPYVDPDDPRIVDVIQLFPYPDPDEFEYELLEDRISAERYAELEGGAKPTEEEIWLFQQVCTEELYDEASEMVNMYEVRDSKDRVVYVGRHHGDHAYVLGYSDSVYASIDELVEAYKQKGVVNTDPYGPGPELS